MDFARLYRFTQAAAFFIIRAKGNLDFARRSYRKVDRNSGLRSDQTIVFGWSQIINSLSRSIARIAFYASDINKRFVFLTNNLTLPALQLRNCTSADGRSNCSSMDQAEPAYQGLLWDYSKCREGASLVRHINLRTGGNRQKTTGNNPESKRNPAKFSAFHFLKKTICMKHLQPILSKLIRRLLLTS